MVSQKVDFTPSVNTLGALKMFPDVSGLKLGLTPSNPDLSGHRPHFDSRNNPHGKWRR